MFSPRRIAATLILLFLTGSGSLTAQEQSQPDDPLRGFDAYATQEVTVRDLLSHRTGVAARAYQLLQYWGSETSRDELVRRLRFEPKEASLRSAFICHNITYTAAGSVAEAETGEPWEDLVRAGIIDPLGMGSTTPEIRDFLGQENVAKPHTRFGHEVFPVPWLDLSNRCSRPRFPCPAATWRAHMSPPTDWAGNSRISGT